MAGLVSKGKGGVVGKLVLPGREGVKGLVPFVMYVFILQRRNPASSHIGISFCRFDGKPHDVSNEAHFCIDLPCLMPARSLHLFHLSRNLKPLPTWALHVSTRTCTV